MSLEMNTFRRLINLTRRVAALEASSSGIIDCPNVGLPVGGRVWVGGKPVTVPERTSNYLSVKLDGSGCSWVDAMPDVMPEDAEIFDVTKDEIHLPGNFGGDSA